MRTMNNIALTLLIVGGLNWGLVGLFNYNLVDALFGNATWISRLVYTLVGLSAVTSFGKLVTNSANGFDGNLFYILYNIHFPQMF